MKLVLSIIAFILLVKHGTSQAEVPNGNFEVWDLYNTWTLEPQYWETANNQLIYSTMPDSNAFEGDLAMKVVPLQGFEGAVAQRASILFAIDEIPASLHFAVKANIPDGDPDDEVSVMIEFLNEDAIITSATWTATESIAEWTEIDLVIPPTMQFVEEVVITVQAGYFGELGGGSLETWISVDDMSLEGTSGVDDASQTAILVYPNPCSDAVTLNGIDNSTALKTIQIFDASGRDCSSLIGVNKVASANRIDLDLSALASGLYQVVVQTDNLNKSFAVATIVKQ
jgi:Secretion system C-terminal sorting domain